MTHRKESRSAATSLNALPAGSKQASAAMVKMVAA